MSDIFVKWRRLDMIADSFKMCAGTLNSCAGQVDDIRVTLKMSDDVAQNIKRRLKRDTDRICELKVMMKSYSEALSEIARLYESTESANLNR